MPSSSSNPWLEPNHAASPNLGFQSVIRFFPFGGLSSREDMMHGWNEQSAVGRYWRHIKTPSRRAAVSPELEMPGRWLNQAARRDPQRVALHLPNRSLNYAELNRRVEHFASRLGYRPDSRIVGICAENPYLTLLGLLAAAKLGRALLPLDPAMPESHRQAMLDRSGCRLVISDTVLQLPASVEWSDGNALLRECEAQREQSCRPKSAAKPAVESILLVVPTSGTCSDPKGVMLSAANLAASTLQVNHHLGLQTDDCWLNCLPLSHVAGLSIPYRCAQAGAAMVLHRGFDPTRIWHDLEAHRVTHLSLVPAMLGRLLDAAQGRMAPATLRVVLLGGGPLDAALAARAHAAGWPLVVCYGMTETGSMCIVDRSHQAGLKNGRVGEPMPGFQIRLSDTGGGEIQVRGDAVMAGYVNPRMRPGVGLRDGWFPTGDLGHWDDEGQLCIDGRADDLLNSGGLRLHPVEVERLLESCPGISAAGVSSHYDPLWGDRLVALYEGAVPETRLTAWARSNLPSGLRPREFRRVLILPRNRLGKLDRKALKQQIRSTPHAMPEAVAWADGHRGSA